MKTLIAILGLSLMAAPVLAQTNAAQPADAPRWSFAIHGGAGVIERAGLSPEQDAAYRAALAKALEAGGKVLEGGGSALDAVEAAIEIMEDDPLFNAGRGAVFTAAGRNELDAAVMNGADLTAGAVAGLTTTRHPIAAARAVMEQSPHVMLIGQGADAFAASVGLEQVPPSFFFTQRRWDQLVRLLAEQHLPIPLPPAGAPGSPIGGMAESHATDVREALERADAANKADPDSISVVDELHPQAVAAQAEIDDANSLGGKGGVIVMATDGVPAFAMSTSGMYRGEISSDEPTPRVAIYADETPR